MMNRPIKFWEFMVAIIGAIITISTLIYNRGTMEGKNYERQVNIERRLDSHDVQLNEIREAIEVRNRRMEGKVDRLTENVNDIKVMLQNKQDRK